MGKCARATTRHRCAALCKALYQYAGLGGTVGQGLPVGLARAIRSTRAAACYARSFWEPRLRHARQGVAGARARAGALSARCFPAFKQRARLLETTLCSARSRKRALLPARARACRALCCQSARAATREHGAASSSSHAARATRKCARRCASMYWLRARRKQARRKCCALPRAARRQPAALLIYRHARKRELFNYARRARQNSVTRAQKVAIRHARAMNDMRGTHTRVTR